MQHRHKLILPSLAAAWLDFVSPASPAQTEICGMHAVPDLAQTVWEMPVHRKNES